MAYKQVAPGQLITSADMNLSLGQGVLRFANAAERATQLPTPAPGTMSYLADTDRFFHARAGGVWEPILGPVAAAWSYATGFADLGGTYQPVRALRAGQLIILQGVAKTTVAVAGGGRDIGYLDAAIRPPANIVASIATGAASVGRCDVMTTGQVMWQGGPISSGDYLGLNLLWTLP